ncbi:hypothetical protein MTO96_015729 [Rhipicephalus appendiculatus]
MTYGKNATLTLSILSVLFVVFLTTYVYKYYGYQIRTLSSWSRRDTDHVQLTYEYVTRTAKACESGRNRTSVLIGVVSSADHFQSRAAIRETWGGTAVKMGFLVVFLLGTPSDQEVQRNVLAEQNAYGDIIQGDFMDTYRNLTYKTVMLIRWARRNCVSVEFVLKIDDDMLLGVWDFAIVVNSLRTSQRSMWGYLYSGFPLRTRAGREVKVGYLISGDVISTLEEFTHDQGFFPLEDVYLTAILAERANVSRLSLEGFSNKHVPYNQPCSTPRVVTSHKWSPDELRRAWTLIVSRLDFDKCLGINKSQMVS